MKTADQKVLFCTIIFYWTLQRNTVGNVDIALRLDRDFRCNSLPNSSSQQLQINCSRPRSQNNMRLTSASYHTSDRLNWQIELGVNCWLELWKWTGEQPSCSPRSDEERGERQPIGTVKPCSSLMRAEAFFFYDVFLFVFGPVW